MTEVATTAGRVRGRVEDGVAVFRGIPFAAPPAGAHAFKPPQPVPAWDGVRDAGAFGPGCRQPVLDANDGVHGYFNPLVFGDDCLTLNVWTPDPGTAGLPVMVWIHGGGYVAGGGGAPAHAGDTWTRDGVVYVSINYRLHVDGFVYLGGDTVNLGLQDQVAALRWVQENIAAFGGDPANVTVFGQSAGGVSVTHLLSMPMAQGLFRRAIAQSGSSASGAAPELATRIAARLGELVGAPPTRDGFASTSSETMLAAVAALGFEYLSPAFWGAESFIISPYRVVIDGEVLPDHPVPAIAAGSANGVDVMAGTTRDEMTFATQPLGMLDSVTDEWVATALDTFGLDYDGLETYRKASRPGAALPELLQAAWTDWAFRIPTLRVLEAHISQPGATYAYEFAWPSAAFPELGATHALELPFVNDRLATHIALTGAVGNHLGAVPPQALADVMHRAWVAFATSGDPGWPQYDAARRTTMRFDEISGPVDDLAGIERELWDGIR
ncbi:MAG TPA: carboxylesterase family protein [Acidimicrobiales bacterium]|nr:carboxylesterase family protein [Acidimicrobiales bacterium]